MNDPYIRTKDQAWKQRAIGEKSKGGFGTRNSKADRMTQVNSDMIFNHKDMKKQTKGYDPITGEIEQRGKPLEENIFIKKPSDEPTDAELKKERKKLDAKKLQSKAQKLYKDRLSTKWDRGW